MEVTSAKELVSQENKPMGGWTDHNVSEFLLEESHNSFLEIAKKRADELAGPEY